MNARAWIEELRSFDWNELSEIEALGQWPSCVRQTLLALWAVLCLAVAYIATIPSERELTKMLNAKLEQEQRVEAARSSVTTFSEAEERLDAVETSLRSLRNEQVTETQRPALVEALEKLARAYDVNFERISLEPAVVREQLLEFPMTISATGGFQALVEFLEQISAWPVLLSVGDFSISDATEENVLRFDFTLSAWGVANADETLLTSLAPLETSRALPSRPHELVRNPFQILEAKDAAETSAGQAHSQLEKYELSQLTMVGTLERKGQRWALVRDVSGKVSRVGVGARLGKHQGRIVHVARDRIELVERIPGDGGWLERAASLSREAPPEVFVAAEVSQ